MILYASYSPFSFFLPLQILQILGHSNILYASYSFPSPSSPVSDFSAEVQGGGAGWRVLRLGNPVHQIWNHGVPKGKFNEPVPIPFSSSHHIRKPFRSGHGIQFLQHPSFG
jgi:hypothetical protein